MEMSTLNNKIQTSEYKIMLKLVTTTKTNTDNLQLKSEQEWTKTDIAMKAKSIKKTKQYYVSND